MGYYDTAQICLNGHVGLASSGGHLRDKYCAVCGEPNIIACEDCRTPIKGDYRQEGLEGHSQQSRKVVFYSPWGEVRKNFAAQPGWSVMADGCARR